MSSEDLQEKPIKSMGYRIYFSLSSVDWAWRASGVIAPSVVRVSSMSVNTPRSACLLAERRLFSDCTFGYERDVRAVAHMDHS